MIAVSIHLQVELLHNQGPIVLEHLVGDLDFLSSTASSHLQKSLIQLAISFGEDPSVRSFRFGRGDVRHSIYILPLGMFLFGGCPEAISAIRIGPENHASFIRPASAPMDKVDHSAHPLNFCTR